ncbi:MAG: adenosylmethionine--8-amino-7-oxononanoate transaminase [Alphaproteobacteria bacterium]|nr:adenosylmethionine--8-amino-7-oxononanoate transaminase [Alphaproteobacteria bacterium]
MDNDLPDWVTEGFGNVWLPYAQMQTVARALPVVATEGVTIELADGRTLIDGIASWWTACHGYNNPLMQQKIIAQVKNMSHVMLGGLMHEGAATLARRLADLLPGDLDHVFFSESGSVAVEIALKMARQYWTNLGSQGHERFVCFNDGYHGDTAAAMAVGDNDLHQAYGDFLPPQFLRSLPQTDAEISEFDQFLGSHRHQIAAVIMEPLVQAAGGMKFHRPETLAAIARTCAHHDVLLILDEIFTGFGRTGTMFACEQAAVTPDIICLGKALTAGTVPMAATVTTSRVYDAFLSDDPDKAFMHGPTYMANPVACAAANASLDIFRDQPVLEQVQRIEGHLTQSLQQFQDVPGVIDVRVKGAIGVIQMENIADVDELRAQFVDAGVWIRPFGDIIYLTPSFTMESHQLAALTQAMDTVLNSTDCNDSQGG